jgi:hypothetical protein
MASTLRGLMVMPCWETMKPNRWTIVMKKKKFRGFSQIFYLRHPSKMIHRSSMYCECFLE